MCDRSATDLKKNLTASTSRILDNNIIDTESKMQSNHLIVGQEFSFEGITDNHSNNNKPFLLRHQ